MKIGISNRCDDVTGDGVESLPGLLFHRGRWGALSNSIGETGQKFRKWFHSLQNKTAEMTYTVLESKKFEGLEGCQEGQQRRKGQEHTR